MNPAEPSAAPDGLRRLAVIGGRLEPDNAAIFDELRRLGRGRIAVLPTASAEPEEAGRETAETMTAHGIEAAVVPLHRGNCAVAAHDPAIVALIERQGSVYFTGGDQTHILSALIQGGVETPVLECIRALAARGGLVAGSSAGAAVMSRHTILGGTSMEALTVGRAESPDAPGVCLGHGLGLFPWGIVDQHFLRRGRFGRLVVALRLAGERFGFGIDENTAMLIEGDALRVVGESALVTLDVGGATAVPDGIAGIRVTYLDAGDAYRLDEHRAEPHPSKARLRRGKVTPARAGRPRRSVFGGYAFQDLVAAAVEGGAKAAATGTAYDPRSRTEVAVRLATKGRRSRALATSAPLYRRYTATDLDMAVALRQLTAEEHQERLRRERLRLLGGAPPVVQSRLVLVGSALAGAGPALLDGLRPHLVPPVGIVAAAAADAAATAVDYRAALALLGLAAETIDLGGEGRAPAPDQLGRLADMRTIVLTGGNQQRLVDALIERGEAKPALDAILAAYRRGGTVVAVSGAVSALSSLMIAGGDSREALRYGIATDAGQEGLLIEDGVGLFGLGILDQNLLERHRIGRLVVACAEEGAELGFGICEGSGLVIGGERPGIAAFGEHGAVVADLRAAEIDVQSDVFSAHGVRLSLIGPGEGFDVETGRRVGADPASPSEAALDDLLDGFARSCGAAASRTGRIRLTATPDGSGGILLDLDSRRADDDHRPSPRR